MNQKTKKLLSNSLLDVLTATLAVLLCLVAVMFFAKNVAGNTGDIPYPLEKGVNSYDPYVQQFDAFRKGQANIDYEADPRLEDLENVYDYQERTKSKIYYLFDRAYYDGKYYSYFGISPLLTFYFPYYAVRGALPGSGTVMIFFAFLSAIFMPLSLFAWSRKFCPGIPRQVLVFACPAVFWGSLELLVCRGHTPFYYVACASALAFFSAFVFFALAAYSAENKALRYVLYAIAGINFGFLFQARTVTAVACAILVLPGLWFFIIGRKRDESGKKKIWPVVWELVSLGAPVLLFFAGSMIFNAVRFSGPLDFGNNYQLTIADVSTYKVRLSDLPFALYHYLFDMPASSEVYPYISFSYVKFSDYGHYLYRDAGIGMLAVPLAYGMVASPALIFSNRYDGRRRVFTACALFAVILVPLLDFCMGGVIYRYLCDFSYIAALFGAIVLLTLAQRLCEAAGSCEGATKRVVPAVVWVLLCAFFVVSVIVCVRIFLINGNGNVVKYSEEVSASIEKILPFKPTK